jgi:TolB-like protein/Flp pilus assembly protein TadD
MSLFNELRRRNVIRMAGLYLVGAWLVTQVAGTVLPMFGAPAWMPRSVVVLLLIGFIPALIFAWVFELTPDGIKRDAEVPPEQSIAPQTARRMEHMIVVLLLLAVAYFGFDKFVLAPKREAAAVVAAEGRSHGADAAAAVKGVHAKSIAVLPFENLSEDKANGFFADGIQDQILTGLAKIGDLKVISRTSTLKYASRPENLSQIARELGVEHILEGSVQRVGNQVRINVQLIEAATDSHLWAETYDRSLEDIFAVETEVAQKIAESLAANLSRGELAALTQKPTEVPAAYEAYLKARAYNANVVQTRQQADLILDGYREAVRLDPNFALAWAQLARECFRTGWVGLDASGKLQAEGVQALARTTELAPDSPQTAIARGVYMYYVKRDFVGALAIMDSLKPALKNDFNVWMWAGYLSRRVGKFDQSLADFERAHELSPNDSNVAYHLAVTSIVSGDCKRGVKALDEALALAPDNTHAVAMKMQCAWFEGDLPRAASYLQAADARLPVVQGLRGVQLLMQRDYPAAITQLRRASVGEDDTLIDAFFDGYLPARLEYKLQLALAEQRAGNKSEAQALYRQVKEEANAALATHPDNRYVETGWHAALGLALAGLGEREAATAHARQVMELVPESADHLEGPGWTYYTARIHALNGDAAHALPIIRHLLGTMTALLSVHNLRFDPAWDDIRDDPGFKALLAAPAKAP